MDLEKVESARIEYKNKLYQVYTVFIIFLLIVFGLAFWSFSSFGSNFGGSVAFFSLSFLAFGIVMIVMAFQTNKAHKKYRRFYKGYFVYQNLAKKFTQLTYERANGLPRSVLDDTQMIYTGDVYDSNDMTTGKYQDASFTQADVTIKKKISDGEDGPKYIIIFKGRVMIYNFPKKFSFRLKIVGKNFNRRVASKNARDVARKPRSIEFESPEYNEMFDTYAEDDFEAFYLLDPAFLNNIVELGSKHNGKILLCFVDNKLVVMLMDGKDAFEPPSAFKPIDEIAENAKISRDIDLITDFVDKLKLNKKVFSQDSNHNL